MKSKFVKLIKFTFLLINLIKNSFAAQSFAGFDFRVNWDEGEGDPRSLLNEFRDPEKVRESVKEETQRNWKNKKSLDLK